MKYFQLAYALEVKRSGVPLFLGYKRAEGRGRKLRSGMEMMEVKVCVSGCGDIAVKVYKYPRPESGVCTCVCVCVG